MDIDAVINEKLDADTDFQASLADLSDEDKNTAIANKKSELTKAEFTALDKKARDNEQKFNDQKTRAEKAERDAKNAKPVEDGFSIKDTLALSKADVHEDDMDEVIDFAKFKKITVAEALKNEALKAILAQKVEVRKSAEVANAKPRVGGQQRPTDDAVLEKTFKKGEIPQKGSEEAEQLFWAKRGGKR